MAPEPNGPHAAPPHTQTHTRVGAVQPPRVDLSEPRAAERPRSCVSIRKKEKKINRILYQVGESVNGCVCVCVRVVLRWPFLFSLCFPFSLPPLPPTSLCSASTPPFHPSELREGWCALSFLLLLLCFRKRPLLKQRETKKNNTKDNLT